MYVWQVMWQIVNGKTKFTSTGESAADERKIVCRSNVSMSASIFYILFDTLIRQQGVYSDFF